MEAWERPGSEQDTAPALQPDEPTGLGKLRTRPKAKLGVDTVWYSVRAHGRGQKRAQQHATKSPRVLAVP